MNWGAFAFFVMGRTYILSFFFNFKKKSQFSLERTCRYCAYVREEGGVPLLEELSTNRRTTPEIRKLARTVLENIRDVEQK